ncbi:hypothetical protein [Paraburkholderia humisilvae]|uniref:hypothetical protein n=1 Tax=Paraburkholderia humisilvae TaxID=627669 RepID=UPI0015835418|nr:hypothetical protein [Paraburkholderia humisilvae]
MKLIRETVEDQFPLLESLPDAVESFCAWANEVNNATAPFDDLKRRCQLSEFARMVPLPRSPASHERARTPAPASAPRETTPRCRDANGDVLQEHHRAEIFSESALTNEIVLSWEKGANCAWRIVGKLA